MNEKKTVEVIDLKAYHEKKKICQTCMWYIQCRGPEPHDIRCPRSKFEYKRD